MQLNRRLQLCRSEMDRYLIELIEQRTWTEGIRYLMTRDRRMPVNRGLATVISTPSGFRCRPSDAA